MPHEGTCVWKQSISCCGDIKHFVERQFYVDDGLLSTPTAARVINLIKWTQEMLAASNLRLHKIASNCQEVMEAFPTEDYVKGLGSGC